MFDLFGRKKKQELFDRAYAEFVSGNYGITERNLSQIINEGSRNFYVFNLRAQTYLALNKVPLALKDSLKSIQIEPNIEKNKDAYDIRNFITNELKAGNIQVNILELTYFFDIENVFQLYKEHSLNLIHEIKDKTSEYSALSFHDIQKAKLLLISYNYLYYYLIQSLKDGSNYDNNTISKFIGILKINLENQLNEIHEIYRERIIHYYLTEPIFKVEQWFNWIENDEYEYLANYVFRTSEEVNRLALVIEFDFIQDYIKEVRLKNINNPMIS